MTDRSEGNDVTANDRPAGRVENGPTRPAFKGCVFCYSAELAAYAARKLAR